MRSTEIKMIAITNSNVNPKSRNAMVNATPPMISIRRWETGMGSLQKWHLPLLMINPRMGNMSMILNW